MRNGLILGYGQKKDGTIDEQTENRCQKALRLYRKGKIQKIYLTVSASKNGVGMADSMKKFLTEHYVREEDIIVERRGGNTAGEIDVFLSLMSPKTKVVIVSTWYHIPRVLWLALWRINPTCLAVGVAWQHAHFKADVLIEFPKLANALLRPIRSAKVFATAPSLQ